MRRQFSWPTRTWNKDEIANLLAMFYPKSKKYNEYIETIQLLNRNNIIQEDLYDSIVEMQKYNIDNEFNVISYTVFRGSMQQRVSEPCSGFGQLLVRGRTRMKLIDFDETQSIVPRPYGDVRVVDEILTLAIHLNLIVYDVKSDMLSLTDFGEKAAIKVNENSLQNENDSFDWWVNILLSNPIVRYVMEIIKNGSKKSKDQYVSFIEIAEKIGFYDGVYYNPETYIGRLYSETNLDNTYIESNLTEKETITTNYLVNVTTALINAGLVTSNIIDKKDESKHNSFTHSLLSYTITNEGTKALFNLSDVIQISLWLVVNSYDRQEDIDRRMMLLTLLSHPKTKHIRGLSIDNLCDFFQNEKAVDHETIILDIFGFIRLGIPIHCCKKNNPIAIKIEPDSIRLFTKRDMEGLSFYCSEAVTGDAFLGSTNFTGLSDLKKSFISYLNEKYQYISLVDYWQYLKHKHNSYRTYEYIRFNKLIADMLYHNSKSIYYVFCPECVLCMENIEIETKPFPIIPLLAYYNSKTDCLHIIDTSALIYNKENTNQQLNQHSEKTLSLYQEPEISIHNAIQSYFAENMAHCDKGNKNNDSESETKYEYMDCIIKNMTQCIHGEHKTQLTLTTEIKYTVLYHEDYINVRDTYENMINCVPMLFGSNLEFQEWYDFIKQTTR